MSRINYVFKTFMLYIIIIEGIKNMSDIGKEVWALFVNLENKYEPMRVTIRKTYPSKWNKEHKDYGIEYERVGIKKRIRIPDRYIYFTEWEANQAAQHLNGDYL